ncbi:hypothetical protein [Agrilutibacter solisilvae]|uniref:Lipoprotein n=1 Tax=Agrilutibacter solisilvae TaxID=2763317 RepID=A0A975ASY9_9GAMM|nr:hypothetical protein [Lysobacter solisilvae]QSX78758.1 hypothetical protein I8J32_002130 [Lysobacter solisilvae]
MTASKTTPRTASLHLSALALAATLAACQPADTPKAPSGTTTQVAAKEGQAQELGTAFDGHYRQGKWDLAAALGEELVQLHPDSPVTARIRPQYEEAKAKALAARETLRTAALWDYLTQPVKGGDQRSAAIYSKAAVDTGGGAEQPVRLIFRDHPDWGRSSYLVLENGDFDCYGGCRVQVTLDDQAPRAMAASRPKTDEAIAMFIEDEAALWKHARNAKTMAIEFPVRAGGKRTAVFEVGGLDPAKMPKW